MKRKLRNNRKGMSIVISTVIIVAISITMAIAVAFWAMGVGNSFTKFEKLEFVSIYADTTSNRATGAMATVANGAVNSIIMIGAPNWYGGSGYTSSPSITITGGGGLGASARGIITNGVVTGYNGLIGGVGYTSIPTVNIAQPTGLASYPIYIQLKNTGSAAATINNVFLDGKPFNVVGATTNLVPSGTTSIVLLQVGQRRNDFYIYLPMGNTWNSGDYVEVEIQTSAGRTYSNTVVIP